MTELTCQTVSFPDELYFSRQKLRATEVKRVAPWLAVIIHQGIQEGVLTTSYPDRVGEVVLSLVLDFGETLGWLLLSFDPKRDDLRGKGDSDYTGGWSLESVFSIPQIDMT